MSNYFRRGQLESIKWLQERQGTLFNDPANAERFLVEALQGGQITTTLYLLDQHISMNSVLESAIQSGNIDLVEVVMNRGYDTIEAEEAKLAALLSGKVTMVDYCCKTFCIAYSSSFYDICLQYARSKSVWKFLKEMKRIPLDLEHLKTVALESRDEDVFGFLTKMEEIKLSDDDIRPYLDGSGIEFKHAILTHKGSYELTHEEFTSLFMVAEYSFYLIFDTLQNIDYHLTTEDLLWVLRHYDNTTILDFVARYPLKSVNEEFRQLAVKANLGEVFERLRRAIGDK